MTYIDYSKAVTNTMAILRNRGFEVNHWTRECYGDVNGKSCMITFYPDDEKYILFLEEGKSGRYISQAELIGILNYNN